METTPSNVLLNYFETNEKRMMHKWMHYFEIYERHFAQFRNKEINLLEFGVLHGGSLQMWKQYFGPRAHIYGADINPRCSVLEEENIKILIADQDNRESLRNITKVLPKFDIIIDDGGHTMTQQINTFEELYSHLNFGGIYLCEDVLTSYWPAFGGGYKQPNTFIEYSKNLIDKLHAWHSPDPASLQVDEITRSTFAVHFYDSVVVIEKRQVPQPIARMKGKPSFPLTPAEQAVYNQG